MFDFIFSDEFGWILGVILGLLLGFSIGVISTMWYVLIDGIQEERKERFSAFTKIQIKLYKQYEKKYDELAERFENNPRYFLICEYGMIPFNEFDTAWTWAIKNEKLKEGEFIIQRIPEGPPQQIQF